VKAKKHECNYASIVRHYADDLEETKDEVNVKTRKKTNKRSLHYDNYDGDSEHQTNDS
jgi:hypothetical protein